MSITQSPVSLRGGLDELLAAVADLGKACSQIGDAPDEQRIQPPLVPFDSTGLIAHMNAIRDQIRETARRWKLRLAPTRVHGGMKKKSHTANRSQGRSGSTGKSSAKKSASASGDSGGGGGGDGDGDGPKRNKKKTVRPKSATPPPKYPPSPTTGAHQVSPPQSPSAPASNRGQETALKGLAVYLFFMIVLVLLGEIELARSFVDSKWIPLVLVSLTKLPKK
ncbi:hypothetical protein JAB5_00240 [Janthinobacterium sp. HH103]|uniref:hypothetical protein n=1 Tax=unclassified Janthinobacterium TaxID=2610881 RepID=UPI000893352D|nr:MULTISPECIES: hypothetical protein [unclassified Janthinobacterium]OEZ64376.1 hypothetical protein JAB2_42260 [Janthinobacterium sp. HH100]OEZ89648.1 hypothetical protein JAB5_00240 [Janthinobacterium sp. HH103]QOU70908.1 hypothetical protein JAB4_003010 [Janthinobacterium sp. HH102]